MGWTKLLENSESGAVASHWEAMSVNSDIIAEKSSCVIGGWVSQEAYLSGKQPISVKFLDIPPGSSTQLFIAVKAFVEAFAKAQPEFEGSEDI